MATFRCPQCDSIMDPSADDGRLLSQMLCDSCAGRKTLATVSLYNFRLQRIRFPLISLFAITGLSCVFFAAIRLLGVTGALVFADVIVLSIGLANLHQIRAAFGVRVPKITFVEFLVLMVMCLMLHGLSMPAVQTNGHRRGTTSAPAPAIVPTVAATSPTNLAPEEVYRNFMIANLTGEESAIRPFVLDHEDAEVLWQGAYPPPVAAALSEQYRKMEISRVGTASDERVVLQSSAAPMPLTVVNVNGDWKVDAAPIIQFRKAAKKLQQN